MIESVSACGWSCTADSTAIRGRVTCRATPRNMRSKSEDVGTLRSLRMFWNQSSIRPRPHVRPGGARDVTGAGRPPVQVDRLVVGPTAYRRGVGLAPVGEGSHR